MDGTSGMIFGAMGAERTTVREQLARWVRSKPWTGPNVATWHGYGANLLRENGERVVLEIPRQPWPHDGWAEVAALANELAAELGDRFTVRVGKPVTFYPCGCSHHKVDAGLCDQYEAPGELAEEKTRLRFELARLGPDVVVHPMPLVDKAREAEVSIGVGALALKAGLSFAVGDKMAEGYRGKAGGRWERLGAWLWKLVWGDAVPPDQVDREVKMGGPPCCGFEASDHRWTWLPKMEIVDGVGVSWFACESCPARILFDPDSEDGFPKEPVVVFPSSCFESPGPCGCPRKLDGEAVHLDGCIGEVFSERHINDTEPPSSQTLCCCDCAGEPAGTCADPTCECHAAANVPPSRLPCRPAAK